MFLFYLSFFVAVLANVLYHFFQKAIAPGVNPVISLMITYVVAFVLTIPLFLIFPLKTTLTEAIRQANWATYGLGLAVVGLEVGFLLAYRAGWNIGTAGVASNAAAAILLLPLGVLFFKDRPSFMNIAGVIICIIGLLMVNFRR